VNTTARSRSPNLSLPAPAKVNLFLHINGRYPNGYHYIQTAFQFLSFGDTLHFFRDDHSSAISMSGETLGIKLEENLIFKAAYLLQRRTGCRYGVDVQTYKRIPVGTGLGGASSNAATTLLALNYLWELKVPLYTLQEWGLELGADVPIFIHGQSAFAEGRGEHFTPIQPPSMWYAVVIPPIAVYTARMYSDDNLQRQTPLIHARDYANLAPVDNDFLQTAFNVYAQVKEAFDWLAQFGEPRLSGSGGALFVSCESQEKALNIVGQIPSPMVGFAAQGLNESPAHTELRRLVNAKTLELQLAETKPIVPTRISEKI
jgi:4-diphosphocytidyl-2-C-methyl-D-erythritol kinase